MSKRKRAQELDAGEEGRLFIAYASAGELCDAFERELAQGALFVPTMAALPAGRKVKVTLLFKFASSQLELDGEVVTALPAEIERAGATPGLSVQITEPLNQLRLRIEVETGVVLPEPNLLETGPQRHQPRYPARSPASIEVAGRKFAAETVDISYNGLLALLPGVDLGEGTEVRVKVEHPGSGECIELDGRIANQTPCDHGVMAVGIQFMYELSQVDDVAEFVDGLRSFHHARSLATVTGSVADAPLESMLETFSTAAHAGTLRLRRGEEQGKLVYFEGEILSATTGLVSGAKAVGRMFAWYDATFEFEPRIEPVDGSEPRIPLESTIISAAVERDELKRLDLGKLDGESTFFVDESRFRAVEPTLGELAREIAENAGLGFPLGALLDIVTASDARIYKALAELIEGGVLRVEPT